MGCPFCGSEKLKVDSKKSNNIRFIGSIKEVAYSASVRCNKCHSRGPTVSIWLREESYNATSLLESAAYEKWNTRI